MGLVSELRRRNVLRMVVLYVVAAWLIMQVAEVIIGLANLPEWIGPGILGLLAIGFPIALIFSWFYEITPEGISLEKDVALGESITHVTGRRLDFLVISMLCAAVILFAWHTWWPSVPTDKSIAVLAFENMSGDPEQEYFSDGISEELLNLLAQIPELRVISRSSSFSFKDKDVAIPTIAAQLNVAHVLEGSVRKMGNRVRITAQLIDASSDSHLWSETYDRELDDIFSVQDEIAAAIGEALKVKLALVAGETVQPISIKAASTDAYDAYLQGRELIRLRGQQNLQDAIRHLERSLRLDSNFAPAHAQLAIASLLLPGYGGASAEDSRRTAILLLDRAEELEPDLSELHAGRALLALVANDPESTIEHARRALESNSSNAAAMYWWYLALHALGRIEEASAILKQMLVIEPLNIAGRKEHVFWLATAGRVEEARALADQLIAHGQGAGYRAHAYIFYLQGKVAESLSWNLRAQQVEDHWKTSAFLVRLFVVVGEYDEARRIDHDQAYAVDIAEGRFDEAIQATQRNIQLTPDSSRAIKAVAIVLYAEGRIDEALPLLERLLDIQGGGLLIDGSFELGITPWEMTMRLALARRRAGDEEGAQVAVQFVRKDTADWRRANGNNLFLDRADAVMAAFDKKPEGVIAALKSAMNRRLRIPQFFDEAVFEDLWDEPRFIALQQELDAILGAEHEKVLQLICFNNPVPDDWQPLPETCEGVEEQKAH